MNEHVTMRRGQRYLDAIRLQFGAAIEEAAWQTDDQVTVTVALDSLPEVVETLYYGHEGWLVDHRRQRRAAAQRPLRALLHPVDGRRGQVLLRRPRARAGPHAGVPFGHAARAGDGVGRARGARHVRASAGRAAGPAAPRAAGRLAGRSLSPAQGAMDYRTRPMPAAPTRRPTSSSTRRPRPRPKSRSGRSTSPRTSPAHFRLFVDGERIIDADYRLFYVHRGMEKLAETRMGYNEVNFLTDRICGICGFTHSFAYSSAVERALGIDVPARAQFIRSIAGEVERLHSNLLNVGLACHFIGFDSGFMQFFRVREKAMTIAELLTGARKTYALTLVGGVRRDIHKPERVRILRTRGRAREETYADVLDILHVDRRTSKRGPRRRPARSEDRPRLQPVGGGGARQRLRPRHPRRSIPTAPTPAPRSSCTPSRAATSCPASSSGSRTSRTRSTSSST